MSDIFFEEMEIPRPDRHLDIHGLPHGAMTGRMVEEIEKVLLALKPDATLVYGDTNSTLAGALAAVKLHIPIAHVEAGLRSFNRQMPEEHNRVLTDHLSTLLFCPTRKAVQNLEREGIVSYPQQSASRLPMNCHPEVILIGDVMYDAVLFYAERSATLSRIAPRLIEDKLRSRPYALVTIHRAENTDSADRLHSILEALGRISRELDIVWPVHPRTAQRMQQFGIAIPEIGNCIHSLEPVGYFDMIQLLQKSQLVMTDSGGLQKEAYFFGKPCLILRQETEWVELIEHGFNRIAGTTADGIMEAFKEMLVRRPDPDLQLYGNGEAGKNIVSIICRRFSE